MSADVTGASKTNRTTRSKAKSHDDGSTDRDAQSSSSYLKLVYSASGHISLLKIHPKLHRFCKQVIQRCNDDILAVKAFPEDDHEWRTERFHQVLLIMAKVMKLPELAERLEKRGRYATSVWLSLVI